MAIGSSAPWIDHEKNVWARLRATISSLVSRSWVTSTLMLPLRASRRPGRHYTTGIQARALAESGGVESKRRPPTGMDPDPSTSHDEVDADAEERSRSPAAGNLDRRQGVDDPEARGGRPRGGQAG